MNTSSPTVISLFSGAGGLDLGFKHAGFKTIFANDNWDLACECLRINNLSENIQHADIAEINLKRFHASKTKRQIDCVIGGPPCPPFSKSRFYLKDKPRALEDSEGIASLRHYIRVINDVMPKTFLFENVHGFIYKPHIRSLEYLKTATEQLGYNLYWKVLNAAHYGVPQIRQRFILVGVYHSLRKFVFPNATHYDPKGSLLNSCNEASEIDLCGKTTQTKLRPWVTSGESIGDIDYFLPEDLKHLPGSKHKDLLPLVPPGENYLHFTEKRGYPEPKFKWRSRYWSFLLKLSPNLPSWTIQASFSNNMGPFHWNNRFLRIQEITRLQTFPDSFVLPGKFTDQWRLIGNAVPPTLAESLAKAIRKLL